MTPLITLHWLGGWASSLRCWEPMLRERFPDFEHHFPDTHVLLGKPPAQAVIPFAEAAAEGGSIVVAWSMGSLLTHHWIEQKVWPMELPLLSLCPVFRFLRPGAFGEPILVRMEKKIQSGREARDSVLRDFWRRMPRAAEIPSVWEESWMNGTRRYSDEALIQGLEFLRHTLIDSLGNFPPKRWELLAGDQDLLSPGPRAEILPAQAHFTTYAGGHLPFWECPEEILAGIRRLIV
jgi:pimeloyl-ACP methyl ester carboxylesterase